VAEGGPGLYSINNVSRHRCWFLDESTNTQYPNESSLQMQRTYVLPQIVAAVPTRAKDVHF
jgi:hypothetical protein